MPAESTKSAGRNRSTDSTHAPASASSSSQGLYSNALAVTARDTARGFAQSARDWLSTASLPGWDSPLSHLESLTTVMFSPLAAHPVYRSESLIRTLQLMQQQQRSRPSPTASAGSNSELVLHGSRPSWPSSTELLKAEIPEPNVPLTLFQGFAAAYPSLATASPTPKRSRHRRKRQNSTSGTKSEHGQSLTQLLAEREQKMRESDKLQMQKSSIANEISQVNLQIEELMNKRKAFEAKWTKLHIKQEKLTATITGINEAILAIQDENKNPDPSLGSRGDRDDSDSEESIRGESGVCFKTLEGHKDAVLCVDFNHFKGTLVSSSMDGTVQAWDLRHNRCLGYLDDHSSLVRCLQIDNESRLITGSDDCTIKVWDLSAIPPAHSPSSLSSVSDFSSAQNSPALSAVTTADDVPPILTNCCISTLEGHDGEITALYSDGSVLVTGSNDKTMKQWDIETQQCVSTLDVMWASSSSNVSSWQNNWSQWTLDSMNKLFDHSYEYIGALQFWNFALASGTVDGKIRMWDLRTGQSHRTLPGHHGAITSLQFDEVHIISGSMDKTIRIWDLRTGTVFDTLTYPGPVRSLQFDASKIVCGSDAENIDVYNRTSFQHTGMYGHSDRVNSVRFRDNVLASASSDTCVKLWTL